jgi:CRP-like cAMP-binding protein
MLARKPQPDSNTPAHGESVHTEFLKKVPLFADLAKTPEAITALAHFMTEVAFQPGSTIIEEGAVARDMYILVEGKVNVFKKTPDGDPFKVAILDGSMHPYFGESALLTTDDERSATITAETACKCLVLTSADFQKYAEANPKWAVPFYRKVAGGVLGRLKKTNSDLMTLYKALVAEIRGTH